MTSTYELATIVASLMHFYALTDIDPEIRQAQFEIFWLPELGEFEPEIIRQACAEWQRQPVKVAPTPGQLRTVCIELRENANFRRDRALPKPAVTPEAEQVEIADIWARNRGFASMVQMQRSPGFAGASIKIGPRLWRRFEPIVERDPVVVAPVKPEPKSEPQKRPTPAWIVERDRQRAEAKAKAKAKALGIDRLDGMVESFMADLVKRVSAQPEDLDEAAE